MTTELNPKAFLPLPGFCAKTKSHMVVTAACPFLSQEHEAALFTDLLAHAQKSGVTTGTAAYTRLVMTNGISREEVVVKLTAGALEWPEMCTMWPCGTEVIYAMTADVLADMAACLQADMMEAAAESVPKIEGYTTTVGDDGEVCYVRDVEDCEWKSATHLIKSEGGKIVGKEPLKKVLPNGIFTAGNLTFTVEDNCLVSIVSSSAGTASTNTSTDCPSVTASCAGKVD